MENMLKESSFLLLLTQRFEIEVFMGHSGLIVIGCADLEKMNTKSWRFNSN